MKPKQIIDYKRALIYCRVSSDRQVNEGHGLDSQEQRCIARASELALEVAKIFRDEGVSGKLFDRPAMQGLISFLDKYPNEKFVIIFDDISRFARDVLVHLKLKVKLVEERGAKLECLNQKFEDTEEGEFLELIFAGKAQLDRKQNRRQVMQKMKARLEDGYWPFCPPPALKNAKGVLTQVEPLASIYKEAIELFRDYKLNTLLAVRDFILGKYVELGIKRTLSISGTQRILNNVLYSGYIEYEPWSVGRFRGKHEGFISYETYLAVQDKLANKAKPRLRKDYNIDFPVRGYALCIDCKRPMTSGWFQGNAKDKKPYYLCKSLDCLRKNKTITREDLENSFKKLLKKAKPQIEVLRYIEAVLNDAWRTREQREQSARVSTNRIISDLEAKNGTLTARISQSSNDAIISEYEKAIAENLSKIDKLAAKLAKIKYPQYEFQTALKTVLNFVESPIKQWESKNYKRQRLLLSMYFDNKLIYHPELGFQTVELPLILELSNQKTASKAALVEMAGVKPASKTHFSQLYSQD